MSDGEAVEQGRDWHQASEDRRSKDKTVWTVAKQREGKDRANHPNGRQNAKNERPTPAVAARRSREGGQAGYRGQDEDEERHQQGDRDQIVAATALAPIP